MANAFHSIALLCLSVFAVAVMVHQAGAAHDPWNRATMSVRVRNELPGVLAVHCKSRDDDLGMQYLPSRGTPYYFAFKSNFWGTTLYNCAFHYGPVLWNSFVVWRGPGLFGKKKMACEQCLWVARLDAFYRAQEGSSPLVAAFPWRNDHKQRTRGMQN